MHRLIASALPLKDLSCVLHFVSDFRGMAHTRGEQSNPGELRKKAAASSVVRERLEVRWRRLHAGIYIKGKTQN